MSQELCGRLDTGLVKSRKELQKFEDGKIFR